MNPPLNRSIRPSGALHLTQMLSRLSLVLTLLCLLALVVTPVLCAHAFAATASTHCAQGMPASMPMPGHSQPPCCAKHPADQPADMLPVVHPFAPSVAAVSIDLPVSLASSLAASPWPASHPQAFPASFRPPLRI